MLLPHLVHSTMTEVLRVSQHQQQEQETAGNYVTHTISLLEKTWPRARASMLVSEN